MSTATGHAPTPVLFGRAARAEWLRLRTVRTTWWCLLAAAVTIIGLGVTAAFETAQEPAGSLPALPVTFAGEFGVLPGQFALLLLALLAATAEHATGQIGPTLQWTPRRRVLLAARLAVPVVVVTVVGVLLALVSDIAAKLVAPDLELTLSGLADSLGRIAAVLAAGGVLAVGIGLLLRSTAGALASVFMLQLVLPLLLPNFGVQWMADLGMLLPGSGATFTLLDEPEMSTAAAAALLVGWAAAAVGAGGWSLLRRDAA
jgi:ABC-2 type transport system permease protein